MERLIAESEAEIKKVERSPLPKVESGSNAFGISEYRPAEGAARARSQKVREMKRALVEKRKALEQIRSDRAFVPRPPLELAVGNFGHINSMKVKTVVDAENMIAQIAGGEVWVKGFPTAGIVDDQSIELSSLAFCSGTKQYKTVIGASKTIFVVEPFDVAPWIEIVAEDGD